MNPFRARESDGAAARGGWQEGWPDALAFGAGLAVAWFAGWQTRDLVWSLWLSSLLVGYAMIVWTIFAPAAQRVPGIGPAPREGAQARSAIGLIGLVVGGLFTLVFFTIHFGMFHLVHSVFLHSFFPMTDGTPRGTGFGLGLGSYLAVLKEYWIFVPIALVAEREAFRFSGEDQKEERMPMKMQGMDRAPKGMMRPYRNVIRLHLLIFFFAFAHFAKLESFLVYAVVYAVYFFPWRLVKKGAKTARAAA
ncbi:MAG TPA: DUF6498-containing protein [Opitutaceae bacterium]|nr:DUF6498-containing protein [Opitutaceae bacterium]